MAVAWVAPLGVMTYEFKASLRDDMPFATATYTSKSTTSCDGVTLVSSNYSSKTIFSSDVHSSTGYNSKTAVSYGRHRRTYRYI